MSYEGLSEFSPEKTQNMQTKRDNGYYTSMAPEPEYEIDWTTLRRSEQGNYMVCSKPKPQKIDIRIKIEGETNA